MYIYESHLGGLYTSDRILDTCDDSDCLIGYAVTKDGAWVLLRSDINRNLDYDYIQKFINENWG